MKKHIISIDALRVIAILGVVTIHTTTRTLEASAYNLSGFPFSIFLNQLARFCIPLFFVISGFVLELNAGDRLNLGEYFRKRLSRIFLPYVFWSAFYYLFIYKGNNDTIINVFLKGNASYQLYFIPALCIFYLAFPILHKAYKLISNKFVLLGLMSLQIHFLYQDYFITPYKFSDPVRISILSFFFFIAGMVASHYQEQIKHLVSKFKYIVMPAALASAIYVFWEGYSKFLATRNYWFFYETWRPSVLVYAFFFVIVFFYLFEKAKRGQSFWKKMGELSFLVFFIHVAILETIWKTVGTTLFDQMTKSIYTRPLFDLLFLGVVVVISFSISLLLHKIPKIQAITG